MDNKDIRWIQRYSNYLKVLKQLKEAVELSRIRKLSKLEQQGLIQSFEYTHELAWNTLKDFVEYKGNTGIYGSRDATRIAFKYGLIDNGDVWMEMIKSRNQTSHTYDENTANEVVAEIIKKYFIEFENLKNKLDKLRMEEEK